MATSPKKASDKNTAKAPAKAPAKAAPKKKAASKSSSSKVAAQEPAEETAAAGVKAPAPAAAAKPATKPAAKPASARAAAPKSKSTPAASAGSKGAADAPAQAPVRETLTPEERERSRKLKATIELLKADPEWPAFLEEQREALLRLRDDLAPNVHNVTREHLRSGASNLSSSSGQHLGDAGSDAEVRALTISLLDKDREQLFEIDAALERIRRGTYGICEISLEPIPKGRLRARPFCRLTVKCQEEYEKKYGSYATYRSKNQGSVGFAGLQNDTDDAISLDDGEE